MIKCKNNGALTCISKSGKPKDRWITDSEAIANAKRVNKKYPSELTKQVAYKCSHCNHYHLTTVTINKKLKL